MDPKIKDYIIDLVTATREPGKYLPELSPFIEYGASPRATLCLALAAKARAFIEGRGYVIPGDIKRIGPAVLRHRIIITYEAEAEGVTVEEIIERLFNEVEVP